MILKKAKEKVVARLKRENLLDKKVLLRAKVLSAEEAIGNPEEYDFPLLKGKEKIIEADFEGHKGHAFTDMYGGFEGTLQEVFQMPLSNNYRRALVVATINALAHYWGEVDHTVHCRDGGPKACARLCLSYMKEKFPSVKRLTLIGYQPAMADLFSKQYEIKILDLDKDNIGRERFGTIVLDGNKDFETAVRQADLVLATGSTLINGTIDHIIERVPEEKLIFFGVTISGTAALLNCQRICFANEV